MILLFLLGHLFLLFFTRFTLWPEMTVYPYLLNKGFLLYKDIINPYPPVLAGFLAIFTRFFGYKPLTYQILTWILILIIDLLIFLISRKIYKNKFLAFASLVFFEFFSLPFLINGFWYDLVQTPFVLISFYYFYKYLKQPKFSRFLFFSFFPLSIAFFIKQQVIWFAVCFLAILMFKFRKNFLKLFLNIPFLLLPFLILLSLQILLFWHKGILSNFLFWVFYFPFFKASQMPGYILLPTLRQIIILVVLLSIFTPLILKKKSDYVIFLGTSLTLLLFAYPRFDYFHLTPFLAILSIIFGKNLKTFFKSSLLPRLIFSLSLILLFAFTLRYLQRNWTHEIRFFEKNTLESAALLSKITSGDESVYIQNGPDQIFVLADRLPIKPWIDEFPWYLELPGMQKKVVEALQKEKPKSLVFKPYDKGQQYDLGTYQPREISSYIDANYKNSVQISDTLWLKIRK